MTKAKRKRYPKRYRVAVHEAGHAVMHWHLRIGWKHVTIKPNADDGSGGHLLPRPYPRSFVQAVNADDRDRHLQRAQREILATLAGLAAERVVFGRCKHAGGSADYHQTLEMCQYFCNSTREQTAMCNWLFERATGLLATRALKPALIAVADALIERETLTRRQTLDVMHRAWGAA